MSKNIKLTGGCLCGALRYETYESPKRTGYCHCTLCQRSSGAPVLAYATIPIDGFVLRQGDPARYASSKHGERWFCHHCGTQIAYCDKDNPTSVDINVGGLDNPELVSPQCHIFESSRISWFDTADQLPRYAGAEPEGEDET